MSMTISVLVSLASETKVQDPLSHQISALGAKSINSALGQPRGVTHWMFRNGGSAPEPSQKTLLTESQ